MANKGKLVAGLMLTLLIIAFWMSTTAQAIEPRPTLPSAASSGHQASQTGKEESQITYELAPGFQAEEVRAQGESGAKRMNLIGMIAWGCIGAGVLVVVVVVIVGSRKHTGTGGVKRTRYYRKAEAETRARRYMDDNRYRKY